MWRSTRSSTPWRSERRADRRRTVSVLDRELATALGRVLAHEIGHVILDVSDHEREGLMRAAFPPTELAEPDRTPYRLTCSGASRLAARLRALTGHLQRNADRVRPISRACEEPPRRPVQRGGLFGADPAAKRENQSSRTIVKEPGRAAGRTTHPGFRVARQPSPCRVAPSSGLVTGTARVTPSAARKTPPSASRRPH
jgi:hypothetical protein